MTDPKASNLVHELAKRLQGQEHLELEFKRASGGIPDDLWPTVSAFANTNGGWIVLGIGERESPRGKEHFVAGVNKPNTRLQDLNNLFRNQNKISFPVCSANDISVEDIEGNGEKKVIIIRVPAVSRKRRPVYIKGNPYTGTFIRRHGGDYKCTKPEVDRMMRDASDIGADSAIISAVNKSDINEDTLARYRRRFQTQDPVSPWNNYSDERFLRAIEAYKHDSETGQEGFTVAGLLLLGRDEAIRKWRTRHLIDFRALGDETGVEDRWEDRIAWEGNLFDAFDIIYPRLVADQPVPFRIRRGQRAGQTGQQIALREAFVNLLVHADYSEAQSSLITRSQDGFLFRNPGSSRVPESDLLAGDRSDPRNPILVRMFRLVGLAEEAGTGIAKIIEAWRELGFRLPAIDVGTERYEFTLRLRYAHLLSEKDRIWLQQIGGEWDEAEQMALVLARHEEEVDNLKLRQVTGQHPADATKILVSLRDRGFLESHGSGRGTHYELGARVAQAEVESLQEKLLEVARPARESKRLSRSERDRLILSLCSLQELSTKELATLLDRNEVYVGRAVRSLVAAGKLQFLYPERPTHPEQKYFVPSDRNAELPT